VVSEEKMGKVKSIKNIGVDKLIPYINNAKQHSEEQVTKIASSIREFGFLSPVLIDKDYNIIAGHGRVLAAKKLELKDVPCVFVEGLTDAQRKAYILADNRLGELADWDMDMVTSELEMLIDNDFDIDLTGFELPEEQEETEIKEDEVPEEVETRCKHGDLWKLGGHRLICGDSTDVSVIDRLMDGVKADMVFTDPPYNIGYQGVSDKRTIQNDKMDDERFVEFLKSSLMNCETMYVCCSWQYAHLFRRAIEENGNKIKAMIVWDKVNPAQHLDKYFKQHEIIWYCGKFGGEKTLRGDIWQVKRQVNTVHPTMKPIELIAIALQDNPDKKIVYDGFGGSGSTLIACEQLNRKCYMCELDPHYCDVIIQRWENFTGQKAVLLNE
jgi:DNA modification methylase